MLQRLPHAYSPIPLDGLTIAECTNFTELHLYRYALMLRCWDPQPDVRPSFTDVVNHLSGDLATKAGYLEFSLIS